MRRKSYWAPDGSLLGKRGGGARMGRVTSAWCAAVVCGMVLLAWAAGVGAQAPSAQQEAPEPPESLLTPSPPTPPGDMLLRRMIPGFDEWLKAQTPFIRDSSLKLHLRSFYFDRLNSNDTRNEAWAFGGWLDYKSGWLLDTFAVGAVGYTSQPLYAPDDAPGTLLLKPPQESIVVLGQLYGQVRYQDYVLLTGYRQAIDEGYVNPQDNRMIPNTFEGVTAKGKLPWFGLGYDFGYITAMKTRNEDKFKNMAKIAGVEDQTRGLGLSRLSAEPIKGLGLYAANYYVADVFSTTYGEAEYQHELSSDLSFKVGVQYTDQRAVGSEFLGPFHTFNVSTGAIAKWRGLGMGTAFSITGDDAAIRTPYGTYPGYLSFQEKDFNRAREVAWGLGVKYDFGNGTLLPFRIPGITVLVRYAHGSDARDAVKSSELPNVKETDFDVTWNIPAIKGLQLRFRNAYVDEGGKRTVQAFRIILNYEFPLF